MTDSPAAPKPCPFCGKPPVETTVQQDAVLSLFIGDEKVYRCIEHTSQLPLYVWNRRPQQSAEPVASAVHSAIRTVRQDVRPYMRHLDDCGLVKFRKNPYASINIPPCTCGLEKVLWDLPAETETGKTK